MKVSVCKFVFLVTGKDLQNTTPPPPPIYHNFFH